MISEFHIYSSVVHLEDETREYDTVSEDMSKKRYQEVYIINNMAK